MTIADSLFVMGSDLCSSHDIGLRLNSSRAKERLPMSLAGGHREGGWVGNDLSVLTLQSEADLGEAELVHSVSLFLCDEEEVRRIAGLIVKCAEGLRAQGRPDQLLSAYSHLIDTQFILHTYIKTDHQPNPP